MEIEAIRQPHNQALQPTPPAPLRSACGAAELSVVWLRAALSLVERCSKLTVIANIAADMKLQSIGSPTIPQDSGMIMTPVYLTNQEFDKALRSGQLCYIYDDLPPGFDIKQDQLNDHLEKQLKKKYHRAHTFVSLDIWYTKSLNMDVAASILNQELILFFLEFLKHNAKEHCIVCGVYKTSDLRGSGGQYLGQIAVNLNEIAVTSTLRELWTKRVGLISFS